MRLSLCLLVPAVLVSPALAQTIEARWLNPVSGDWNTASNWDTGNVPNTDLEEAIISATPGGYTVSMGGLIRIARLSLNAGRSTTLNVCQGCILSIQTTSNALFNAGTILVGVPQAAASAADAKLSVLLDNTEINGSGVIRLQGYPEATNAQIQKITFGGGVIIGGNQTIEGAGRISLDGIVNNGSIVANVSGHDLHVVQSAGITPFVNSGLLEATGGGQLLFGFSLQNEPGSEVIADADSAFRFVDDGTHTGGTLAAVGTGEFQYAAPTTLTNITLSGRHEVQPFGNLIINTVSGPVTNQGTIDFENGQQANLVFQSIAGESVPLSGTGTLRFSTPIEFAFNASIRQSNAASVDFVRLANQNVEGNFTFRTNARIGRKLAPGLAAALRVGTVYVEKALRMNPASELEVDITGTSTFDRVLGNGTACSLTIDAGSTLRVRVPNNFTPGNGEAFNIVDLTSATGPNVTGQFDTVILEHNNPALSVAIEYTPRIVRARFSIATCDSIDFNADTLFPDDTDLVDFLSVLAGGPCTNDPNCNDIDFNNDGLFPDDNDLVSFLRVLAGGSC